MKTKLSISLLFFLFIANHLSAQLEKGDYFSTPTLGLSYSFEGPHKAYQFGQSVSFSQAKMVSNSVMLGMGLSLANSAFRRSYISSAFTTVDPFFFSQVTAQMRIYFQTKKWAPYFFFSTSYWNRKFRESHTFSRVTNEEMFFGTSQTKETERRFNVDIGLGLNYFLTPNLALEFNLGWTAYKKETLTGFFNPEYLPLYLNTSFVFLFKKTKSETTMSLKDRYLKAGNILVSGRLSGGRSSDDGETVKNLSLNTETNYFLGSRTIGISKISCFRNSFDYNGFSNKTVQLSLGFGIKHFIPLNDNLFLSLQGEIITGSFKEEGELQQRNTFIPLAADLNYFKKQTRYFIGTTYSIDTYSFFSNDVRNSRGRRMDAYTGFDYFFRPSFYLRGQLTTVMNTDILAENRKLPKVTDNLQWLRFSMSLGFMIN